MQELTPASLELDRLRIKFLGPVTPPDENDWSRSQSAPSAIVRAAIHRLAETDDRAAGPVLDGLAASDGLEAWQPTLRHARSEQARIQRDKHYSPPSLEAVVHALSGGAPATSADLVAIVVEELRRYRSTLRTAHNTPWKAYWNTDSASGAATVPRIENEDRDRLLDHLEPSLSGYQIAGVYPEARRGENTRADILLLAHAGRNVPIEIKRAHNRELWTAIDEQLRGYAADEGANGAGIFLVFWFGEDFRPPPRPSTGIAITFASELEAALTADIPADMKQQTTVIVLDVSRPEAMRTRPSRRRRRRSSPDENH